MRRAQPLRIVSYAVNGLGLGHLTRLIAINRQLRRLTTLLGISTEFVFLTSSEGDSLCFTHHFAAFKIPSKTIAPASGLTPDRYRKLAKQWVWNAINLASPDLLIVDTFPMGAFNELVEVLDLGSKNVFVYRAVRPEVAAQPAFQGALRGYQQILLPLEAGENASPMSDDVRDRAVSVAPILLRSNTETLSRADARKQLGLSESERAVYVSTGGGGDREAETFFSQFVEVARALPETVFVVGAGILYRGKEFHAPNVRWTRRPVMIEAFPAFDAALTAGGFNSVWELMHCGVPCLFLPRARGHDDQEERVERCVSAGAGLRLESLTVDALARGLALLTPQMAAAARRLMPKNGALDAAEAILSLVIDAHLVETAALLIEPSVLARAERLGHSEESVLKAARRLWRTRDTNAWNPDELDSMLERALETLLEENESK